MPAKPNGPAVIPAPDDRAKLLAAEAKTTMLNSILNAPQARYMRIEETLQIAGFAEQLVLAALVAFYEGKTTLEMIMPAAEVPPAPQARHTKERKVRRSRTDS